MDCQTSRELLSNYFDGELDPSLASELRQHLTVCPVCADALHGFQALSKLAKECYANHTEPTLPAPAFVHLPRVEKPAPVFSWWISVAAATLLVISVWFFVVPKKADRSVASNSVKSSPTTDRLESNSTLVAIAVEPYLDLVNQAKVVRLPDLLNQTVNDDVAGARLGDAGSPVSSLKVGSLPLGTELVFARDLPTIVCQCGDGTCRCEGNCRCMTCGCQRADGTQFLVMEHPKELDVDFGKLPVGEFVLGETSYKKVTKEGLHAISWVGNSRRFTAVGLRDEQEISSLLAAFP